MDKPAIVAAQKPAHNTALLIIDVQHGLFRKSTRIWGGEQLLSNINLLIERARAAAALVVYVQHNSDKVLPHGSADWQLHPGLTPPAVGDPRVEKKHGNAFESTGLEARLDAAGVGRVVVAGLVTHGCVKATCQGALDLGYEVVLASDAHSSYSKDAASLVGQWNQALAEAGATLQSSSEIVFAVPAPAA